MSNRGMSSDIFIWIFAVIAGALLLFFFILWGGRHATTSTTVEDITFLRTFEQQLFSLSASDSLSKTLTFPGSFHLRVACDTLLTDQATEKTSLFLFSPTDLPAQQPYTLVGQPWSFPFFIDLFYYLFPKDTLFVLFYEPQAASFVTSLDIPSTFPLKTLPLSAYSLTNLQQELRGYRAATIIFAGHAPTPSTLLASFRSLPITLLEADVQQSQLTFYPSGQTYPYYGEAHLLAAFFGPDNYKCQSQRALERLHRLAALYQQKVTLLYQKLGSGSSCQSLLSQGSSLLSTLSTSADSNQLHATVISLQTLQEDLERNDCPTIY